MKWFSPHAEPRRVAVSTENSPTPHQLGALRQRRCFSPWGNTKQDNVVNGKKYPDLDLGPSGYSVLVQIWFS